MTYVYSLVSLPLSTGETLHPSHVYRQHLKGEFVWHQYQLYHKQVAFFYLLSFIWRLEMSVNGRIVHVLSKHCEYAITGPESAWCY